MAYLVTADAVYVTTNPQMVGTAHVWDVVKETDVRSALVGKVVLRDGQMYVRDLSACGEPLYLPAGFGGLFNMLYYAHGVLFDTPRAS